MKYLLSILAALLGFLGAAVSVRAQNDSITAEDLASIKNYFLEKPHEKSILRITADLDTAVKYKMTLYKDLGNSISLSYASDRANVPESWAAQEVVFSIDSAKATRFVRFIGTRKDTLRGGRVELRTVDFPLTTGLLSKDSLATPRDMYPEERDFVVRMVFHLFIMKRYLAVPFPTPLENRAFKGFCRAKRPEDLPWHDAEVFTDSPSQQIGMKRKTMKPGWDYLVFNLATRTVTLCHYGFAKDDIVEASREEKDKVLENLDLLYGAASSP